MFYQLPRQADLRVVQRADALGPEDVARISFDLPDDRPIAVVLLHHPAVAERHEGVAPRQSPGWSHRALPAWRKSGRTCPSTARCGWLRPARSAPPGSPRPRRNCPAARAPRLPPARRAGPERVVPSRETRTGFAVRPSATGLLPVRVSTLVISLRLRNETSRLPSASRSSAFPWVQFTVGPDRVSWSTSVISKWSNGLHSKTSPPAASRCCTTVPVTAPRPRRRRPRGPSPASRRTSASRSRPAGPAGRGTAAGGRGRSRAVRVTVPSGSNSSRGVRSVVSGVNGRAMYRPLGWAWKLRLGPSGKRTYHTTRPVLSITRPYQPAAKST